MAARGRSPQPPGRAPGLSRAGGWHAWPARGAGARGGLARLARAGGWRARGAGAPGLARELAPAPTGLVLVETLLGPSWPPPL